MIFTKLFKRSNSVGTIKKKKLTIYKNTTVIKCHIILSVAFYSLKFQIRDGFFFLFFVGDNNEISNILI